MLTFLGKIISEFLLHKIIDKSDLSRVTFDYATQLYDVKFHLTVLNTPGDRKG